MSPRAFTPLIDYRSNDKEAALALHCHFAERLALHGAQTCVEWSRCARQNGRRKAEPMARSGSLTRRSPRAEML